MTSSNIASFTGTARTIQAHPTGGFAVAGESGLFRYYNSSETFVFSENIGTENINALAFIDNTYAVAVGDNGAYYKSTNAQVDSQGSLTGLNWQQKTRVFNADPYEVNAANQVNIYTIAFPTATNAVFGGEYTVNFTPNPITQAYVRTLFDPNSRYSNRFFYDKLGRPVVSQNARQFNEVDVFQNAKERKYSYMLYDGLGRVVEAGEKWENTNTTNHFANVFGTMVSGYYNPSVMDDAKLLAWINGDGPRKEVTKSYYDETLITGLPGDFTPNVLTQRKRIVHVTYEEDFDGNDQTFDHATHYDYDIHGNVNTLLQDNRKMAQDFASIATQRFKRMDYTYDLVSGNVHRMSVTSTGSATASNADQWHHAYKYDADNRITHAYTNDQTPLLTSTSSATVLPQALENELTQNADWQQEASYFYYAHGPLARTEIGQDELQGCDYIYNLQGWMKGVNSTSLDETIDPGKDGLSTSLNGNFARDVYGFGLHYYNGDYMPIGALGTTPTITDLPQASINPTSHAAQNATTNDLFNGNIRYMETAITNPDTRAAMPMLNVYQFDQLNRLLESRSYEIGLSNNVWNPTGYNNEYFNAFTFDPNGNILTQKRHKRDGTQIEDMTYRYNLNGSGQFIQNRLYHINDAIASGVDNTDIDDMGTFTAGININSANNYSFDEEGRLIRDLQEGIENIVWRVDGKVKSIERPLNSGKKNVSFDYDAFGNRIAKHVFDDNWMLEKSTYYVLDASGNQVSVYEHEVDAQDVLFSLKERHIYGSSTLGIYDDSVNMYTTTPSNLLTKTLGKKFYQLSEHRGNVLTVISDIKTPVSTGTTVDYYDAHIVNIADYSGFGVELDGRTIKSDFYRRGFQNQEVDDEIKGEGNSVNYRYRMHDPRVGRFFAVDPLASNYPWNSPYAFSENVVISHVELEGLEKAPSEAFASANAKLDDYEEKINSGEISSDVKDIDLCALVESLRREIANPNSASCQYLGYYCGKNAIQNVAINYDPENYVDYIMDLAINGEAKWGNKGAKTKLDKSLIETGLEGGVEIASEIFGKSLNYTTTNLAILRRIDRVRKEEKQQLQESGASLPWEVGRMAKRVGLKVEKQKIYRKINNVDLNRLWFATVDDLIPIIFDNYVVKDGTPHSSPTYEKWGIHYLAIHRFYELNTGNFSINFNDYGGNTDVERSSSEIASGTKAYFILIKK